MEISYHLDHDSSFILPVVYLLYPEPLNRNLELINTVFWDAESVWHTVPMARHLRQGDAAAAGSLVIREKYIISKARRRLVDMSRALLWDK
jgi:hypothetical protein